MELFQFFFIILHDRPAAKRAALPWSLVLRDFKFKCEIFALVRADLVVFLFSYDKSVFIGEMQARHYHRSQPMAATVATDYLV